MSQCSFEDTQEIGYTSSMADKIVLLQQALKQISDAKRQLCRNTAEAKSRIQCNISRQLETLRNREVWLLNQLDVVSSAKEEVLQQQSARLNQTLGVLHSSVQYPNIHGDQINGLDLSDIQPEETPFVSFKSDPTSLREAIMNYGRIDPNSVPPMQSPFMAPDQPAPSLPKQFEDYNDAEHHILYKTVEEINYRNTNQSCVQVNIPKLSGKLDDWLLYPSTGSAVSSDPRYTFPQLSNNLSDWLRAPISVTSSNKSTPLSVVKQECAGPLEGISTDASIKTWLHKIKQCPYEEEEEDYDFVEEMSDVRTQCSGDFLDQFTESDLTDRWLQKSDTSSCSDTPLFQIQSLPMDKWLFKSDTCDHTSTGPVRIDMSRYLRSITDELDQWLLHRSGGKSTEDSGIDDQCSVSGRPTVPSSLNLQWRAGCGHLSRIDNPWLHRPHTSTRSASSKSPVSSRSSSFSRASSRQLPYNRWLLKGGYSEDTNTSMLSSSLMEKYKKDTANMLWLKADKITSSVHIGNPMAGYEADKYDASYWLKPEQTSVEPVTECGSPLDKALEFQNSSNCSIWLLNSATKSTPANPRCFEKIDMKSDSFWLHTTSSQNMEKDMKVEAIC